MQQKGFLLDRKKICAKLKLSKREFRTVAVRLMNQECLTMDFLQENEEVVPTGEGSAWAQEVLRRHHYLTDFLQMICKVKRETAEENACRPERAFVPRDSDIRETERASLVKQAPDGVYKTAADRLGMGKRRREKMERRDCFDRMKRPTLEQVRYLDEIGRAKKKWGAAAQIAKNHDISHASISRFFRNCIDAGYLDADYQVTADGKEWIAYYQSLELALTRYLQESGAPKEDIPRNVQVMAEQMDSDVLSALLDGRGKHGWNAGH